MAPASGRYTRKHRLVSAAQYQRVFDQPQKKSGDKFFTLLAQPNEVGTARLGLAVSSKAVRHAVARNRIKRIARETFRLRRERLDTLDFIVIARSGADRKTKHELHTAFDKIWSSFIRCKNS